MDELGDGRDGGVGLEGLEGGEDEGVFGGEGEGFAEGANRILRFLLSARTRRRRIGVSLGDKRKRDVHLADLI